MSPVSMASTWSICDILFRWREIEANIMGCASSDKMSIRFYDEHK